MSIPKALACLVIFSLLAFCGYLFIQNSNDSRSETRGRIEKSETRGTKLEPDEWLDKEYFLGLLSNEPGVCYDSLIKIRDNWRPEYELLIIECWKMTQDPYRSQLFDTVMMNMTGINEQQSFNQWMDRVWEKNYEYHPDYMELKSAFYSYIHPSIGEYFKKEVESEIRLDEILWGGVVRDGIPPLINPKMLSVDEAEYLEDSNVVFGIEVNGEARCYPKRILAHHEMFKDTVGGVSVNGVYCTLCGSMILYKTEVDGKHYELGTSGLLYRNNKLMYDAETVSLWSTLEGKPVLGELLGKGIELEPMYVVTTTWGQWKADHPETTVLSLDTGHDRNYGEGEAYKGYFATDDLMFNVLNRDDRLKNKEEILAIRLPGNEKPTAITAKFLSENPVYALELSGEKLVVLTDTSGANRVYNVGETVIASLSEDGSEAIDSNGKSWQITEAGLTDDAGVTLARVGAHRAFWFGWYAQYPNTELIQ